MSSEKQSEDFQPVPVAPPPPPGQPKSWFKRNKKRLITGVSVLLTLIIVAGIVTSVLTSNNEKLAVYDERLAETVEAHENGAESLTRAGELEPELQERLDSQLSTAQTLIDAQAPSLMSFNIEERTTELSQIHDDILESVNELQDVMDTRSTYTALVRSAEGTVEEAQELLKKTKDKVEDKKGYTAFSDQIKALEEALESKPDASSVSSYSDKTKTIQGLITEIDDSVILVNESHESWKDAEEAAAKRDPANYKSISDRDWQLVERSPFLHSGEKYVVYGAVTQADSNTGLLAIRVNTGGTKQSRRYNYDINTYVNLASFDMISDIVQDDHVKMLVEVNGSKSYSTTMGGTISAVEVTAYDIEVIGQF